MKHHPSFKYHTAKTAKARIDAIMHEEPITLPFIKSKLTLWQRIKKQLTR
jgi:hypothetical protein